MHQQPPEFQTLQNSHLVTKTGNIDTLASIKVSNVVCDSMWYDKVQSRQWFSSGTIKKYYCKVVAWQFVVLSNT